MAKPAHKKKDGASSSSAALKPRNAAGKKKRGDSGKSKGFGEKNKGSKVAIAKSGHFQKKRSGGGDQSRTPQEKKRKLSFKKDEGVNEDAAKPSDIHKKFDKKKPVDRKAKKELLESRKRKRKPNFDIEKDVVSLWEKMRQRNIKAEDRSRIVSETLAKMKGKMVQMAMSHSCSRVLQSCVKHSQEAEKNEVFQELRPSFLDLCLNTYACHLALRMIDNAKKDQLQQLLSILHGNVVRLLRHPTGSAVVEHAYHAASGSQKQELVSEFFSPEFRLFRNITKGRIKEMLSDEPAAKRKTVLEHMTLSIQPILEKGIVDHSIIHRVLVEYLSIAPMSMVSNIVDQLSGPLLVRMLHTADGAKLGVLCVRHGSAKQRKKIIKALKGQVLKVARDDHGYAVLLSVIDVVDDTELVTKVIMSELATEIRELSVNKYGQRLILHLLAPNIPRYFPAELLKTLKSPVEFISSSKTTVDTSEKGDDECGDVNDGDDNTESARISKKDPFLRRTELLSKSGFAQKLVEACATNAGELLRSPLGKDVIYEVARGGVDGIMLKATPEGISSVHKAIADLAALPKDKKTEEEHVLEHYHASRTIRRLVLDSSCHKLDGSSESFAQMLWSLALQGRCTTWARGHSAKVVAAFRDSEDPAVRRVAKSEINSLVDSGVLEGRKAKATSADAAKK
ncbi:pumilio homolog 24 isoform X2 [Selaginella moellendorffii]|uniref:pumilio homolog 24 isoform X2 n=1 Tax=Selaginella moellendorffii TaxID=88036 RepID=UPI000D1C5E24|nr:pumilio homolog 24 isoform X2 [Selaginella moellendorffii]|eukprot:XP_024527180.1 pumilio homolog 24 isoform X2 [Selaginella moellendorffii]